MESRCCGEDSGEEPRAFIFSEDLVLLDSGEEVL
jgi:hypothetical protein